MEDPVVSCVWLSNSRPPCPNAAGQLACPTLESAGGLGNRAQGVMALCHSALACSLLESVTLPEGSMTLYIQPNLQAHAFSCVTFWGHSGRYIAGGRISS